MNDSSYVSSKSIGIHTFELIRPITYNDFKTIREYYSQDCVNRYKFYKSKSIYVCDVFKNMGINISVKTHWEKSRNHFYGFLYLRVNPSQILYSDWEIRVFDPMRDNLFELTNKLDMLIKSIPLCEDGLLSFIISRCDLCANIHLDNQECVESYIKLVSRRGVPSNSTTYTCRSKTGHRKIAPKGSVIIDRKTYALTVYDKHDQMESNKNYFSAQAIQQSEGVLRIELQLYSQKIGYELLHNNIRRNDLARAIYHFAKNAVCFLSIYCDKIFHSGHYVTLRNSIEKIATREGYASFNGRISELLKLTAKYRNLEKGILELACKSTKEKTKSVLKELDKMEVNPVCLPSTWYGEDALLPSLSHLLTCPAIEAPKGIAIT